MKTVSPSDIDAVKRRFSIIGNSPALLEAIGRSLRVAPIDLSVLIIGESGSGKEFFPQIIHAYGPRKHAKYIAVNCGAIPQGTIDSELFGHEKGSFTGAVNTRKGYFEEADGGTIFLDEVAELPLTTQARLLRVLETGEFIKVGSSQVQKTNIRIVAATNVDMAAAVAQGKFREDLYYRLSTVQINIPPLRERGDDILLLARHFAREFAERYSTPALSLSRAAQAGLLAYRWPGNVRQLKNVVEQLALFEGGHEVDRETLQPYLPQADYALATATGNNPQASDTYARERDILFNMIFALRREVDSLREQLAQPQPPAQTPLRLSHPDIIPTHSSFTQFTEEDTPQSTLPSVQTLEERERQQIIESLQRNGGKRKQTAAELNMSERNLYRKIKAYGLE